MPASRSSAATVIIWSLVLVLHLSETKADPFSFFGGRINVTLNPFRAALASRAAAREFLNAHNQVRALKGLPPLVWDNRLARYARRYGNIRKGDCELIHSDGTFGENLFWGGKDHWTPTEVVKSWADEELFYDVYSNTCQPGQMCGHYTQVVWRNTARVGCARQKCDAGGVFVICNYDPPGNFVGEHPFGGPLPGGALPGVIP